MSREGLAHFALAGAATIYGANYIIAKSVMPDPVDPDSFIVLRVTGAALLFAIFTAGRMKIPDRSDWGRILLCAICGVATNQLFFFNGLALTSPINASIIMTSNPIIVMIISAVLLRKRITALKIGGVIIGAVGAATLLILSGTGGDSHSSVTGDIFILINSISYGFYLVLVKPLMEKYHPMVLTAWVFIIGIFLVLPFGGMGISHVPWDSFTSWQWFCLFYVIVFTTFLTYLFNIFGIYYLSPTVASAYIYFQPLLAALFAWLFSIWLHEDFTSSITWSRGLCALLIFIGVFLVSRSEAGKMQIADSQRAREK